MKKPLLPGFQFLPEVAHALSFSEPCVALETTVVTHGLPYPENLSLAGQMEQTVRDNGATPATIGVLDGTIHIGMKRKHLELLATHPARVKISSRDFAAAIAQKRTGGTTVAATLVAAHAAGIQVFATGGIGGVHRQAPFDISADLIQLARTPVVVVCAGAKAILDLPATLEFLETYCIPVVGYQTSDFPAFYSRSSGLPVSTRAETALEAAHIARAHWDLGMTSAILLVVPPPEDAALSHHVVDEAIQEALEEARREKVRGQAVTPFLLKRVSEITGGESLKTNLALLLNNARVASEVAVALSRATNGNRVPSS